MRKVGKTNQSEVIAYLNLRTGGKFRGASAEATVNARFAEGYLTDDLKLVVDHKVEADKFFRENPKYYRPVTIFQRSKFGGYLLEATRWKAKQDAIQEAKSERIADVQKMDVERQQERDAGQERRERFLERFKSVQ